MLNGLEVLIWWDYLMCGRIEFDVFIFVVEEMGTIVEIGCWVFYEVC